MSSDFWQNNLESSHLEGGESRSICFLGKLAAVDKGQGRMMGMDGLIACLFYITSWEISIVSTKLCLVFEFELGPGSRGQARPGGGTGHSV